jgi:hypothetical protein
MVSWWRRACGAALVLVATVLSIAACGGGGGVGEGGTGTFVAGPVTGLGSVTVGGVRFDDDNATFEDDDDASGSVRDRLRLGMFVAIEGGAVTLTNGESTATASRVRFGRAVVGPVTFDGVGADSLRVLGLRVRLTQATVRGPGLEGDLSGRGELVSRIVALHGFFSDGLLPVFVATRIDLLEQTPARFKVVGVARDVDSTAATLRIGGQVFDLSAVSAVVREGDVVRLRVDTARVNGRWVVREIVVGSGQSLPNVDDAKLEGAVTSFDSQASFGVNGIPVTSDATTQFPDGSPALGDRVKVRGSVLAGVLRAREVEIRSDEEVDNDSLTVHGSVVNLDLVARTFVVRPQQGGRDVAVTYDGTTDFGDGRTAADLATPGVTVEVEGRWSAASGRLLATEIEFE